ncbi:hypothetical protein VNO77_01812 [Canavalia gladiata]|uniref:Uncharacterized protein n=1 Tax=Canavalia gladiata TaxID=3824 RepID=A0AAN9MSI0_CANGL
MQRGMLQVKALKEHFVFLCPSAVLESETNACADLQGSSDETLHLWIARVGSSSPIAQDAAELQKSFSKLFSIVADLSSSCKDQSHLKWFSALIERISLTFSSVNPSLKFIKGYRLNTISPG